MDHHEDIQLIKEKLGIKDQNEFDMKNEDIEKELEEEYLSIPTNGAILMKKEFAFTRIGYVYVPTTNIDESIEWYTRNLDFKVIDKFQDRGSFLAVMHQPHKNSIALLLIETRNDQSLEITRNGQPFPIMALNCPDIEFTHNFLKKNQIEVQDIQALGAGEAKYFYFRDNQGNLLEAAWSIWDPEDEIKEDF